MFNVIYGLSGSWYILDNQLYYNTSDDCLGDSCVNIDTDNIWDGTYDVWDGIIDLTF
jgi:hypothetical protein